MARPQDVQEPPPPAVYDRDDYLVSVLAGALRAQTDAVVDRLDGVTSELRSTREALVTDGRSTREALVADARSTRRLVALALVIVAALAGVGVAVRGLTLTPPPPAVEVAP